MLYKSAATSRDKRDRESKKLGAKLVAVKHDKGYLVAIQQEQIGGFNGIKHCPFFDIENGDCKIYNDRFDACRSYECEAIGMDATKLSKMHEFQLIGKLVSAKRSSFLPKYEKKATIRKYNIEIVEINEAAKE